MAEHNAGSQRRPKRRIMRALKINEISAVDVPAQEGAVALIMKRNDAQKAGTFEKQTALTSPEDGTSHLVSLNGPDNEELNSGFTSFEVGHRHPWVRMAGGEIVIGTARRPEGGEPHIHRVAFMSKAEDQYECELENAEGELEKHTYTAEQLKQLAKEGSFPIAPNQITTAGKAGNPVGDKEEPMTDKTKKAADDKTVEELQAQLVRANAIGALNDAEKAHMSTLEDGAKEDFLAKSAEDRAKIVKDIAEKADKAEKAEKVAAKEDDPIAYTTTDGVEIRKSAGEAFIAIATSNDVIRKENTELRKAREQDVLEKRADAELPNLPGTVETRAAMLKAIDGIKDETQRQAAHDALKAQNVSMAKAFETAGHGGTPAAGSPDESLDLLAKKHNEANPALTFEQSYDAVMKTAEGADLYAKSVN